MIYVLDTSIILSSGKTIFFEFPGQEVVVPLIVVKELEQKRNDLELGLSARSALRFIEDLRNRGDLRKGVDVGNSGTVRIEVNHVETSKLPQTLRGSSGNDVKILSVALSLNATLVSRDLPLRIMAGVVGIPAKDHETPNTVMSDLSSVPTIFLTDVEMSDLYGEKSIASDNDLMPNSYAIATTYDGGSSALVRAGKGWKLHLVPEQKPSGVSGRSAEQRFALDALMNKDTKIVSLGGRAGTGKTMLSLATGLQQVRDRTYSKVVVFRNMWAVGGQDLGFLPGTAEEKMSPWTAAVWDAMGGFLSDSDVATLQRQNKVEVLPLTHIRGRTLNSSFIIIDEAQNLEASTLLTALSRTGNGSKVVLSFDIDQRDNPYVGKHTGIIDIVSRLKGESLFSHVTLLKSERSDVAELTSRLLVD